MVHTFSHLMANWEASFTGRLHIFCKVGVKSRTELAAVLVKRLRCA